MNGISEKMKKIITTKTHKLKASWKVEDLWPDINFSPSPSPAKNYKSITESILRALYRKYSEWRDPHRLAKALADEITTSLANEIKKEIDDEILKDLIKTIKVPKEIL